jgi:plastocyanin
VPRLASNSIGGPGVGARGWSNWLFGVALFVIPVIPVNTVADSSAPVREQHAENTPSLGVSGLVTVVKMSDNDPMYNPSSLVIRAGQTIEWKNDGDVSHSVTDDPKNAENRDDVDLPTGAKPFNSGSVMPGRSFRHTFVVPGKYRYFCLTHESDRMIGEITVEPSSKPDDESQPWRTSSASSEPEP